MGDGHAQMNTYHTKLSIIVVNGVLDLHTELCEMLLDQVDICSRVPALQLSCYSTLCHLSGIKAAPLNKYDEYDEVLNALVLNPGLCDPLSMLVKLQESIH